MPDHVATMSKHARAVLSSVWDCTGDTFMPSTAFIMTTQHYYELLSDSRVSICMVLCSFKAVADQVDMSKPCKISQILKHKVMHVLK